jgi:hypothetical protein
MSYLSKIEQPSIFSEIQNHVVLFTKKALALSFSLLLIGNFFFIPFASDPSSTFFPAVRAAYIACSGTVFVNGALCNPDSLTELRPGDSIATDSQSEATLVYSDTSLVRLEKTTIAALGEEQNDQIHVVQGAVWLNTKGNGSSDAFTLSMPEVKVRVPQGSAAVAIKGKTTQLLTASSPVEVQIDRQQGVTELVAVAPETKLTVRQNRAKAFVRTSDLDPESLAWVMGNHSKDDQYLDIVREKFPFVFETEAVAEALNKTIAGPNLITKKLLEANQAVLEKRGVDAKNALLEIAALVGKDQLSSDLASRSNLAMLAEIEQESPDLMSLVKEIRGKMIVQLRLLTIKTSEEVVGNSISGMAYRSEL